MRKTSKCVWQILLAGILACMLASCAKITPTTTPIPTLTPRPIIRTAVPSPTVSTPYIHFTLSKAYNINLEFDYPRSWDITKTYYPEMKIIVLFEPRFRTLPPPAPDDFHPTPNDYGKISIWVTPIQANQTLDDLLAPFIKGHAKNWITTLHDYMVSLNGYDARVLEYQVDFAELYTSVMFVRHTAFISENQLYEVDFEIAERDRGGEFEKGYEYFLNSLKVVP